MNYKVMQNQNQRVRFTPSLATIPQGQQGQQQQQTTYTVEEVERRIEELRNLINQANDSVANNRTVMDENRRTNQINR